MTLQSVEALDLRESAHVLSEASGPIAPDGTVTLHVIRPGLGRGKGNHLYEARMLEENAHKFVGWKMFVNHLSPEAKRAAGGLPRDVRDLGGRIVESWWDGSVPANPARGHGPGAVVARAKPTPFIRELIANDPEIVEASISATATGVRPGEHGGKRCWIVEGIDDRGSVDWVTEAGAGGRVVSIMEAAYEHDTEGRLALLASLTDSEFTEYLFDDRPEIAEALMEATSARGKRNTNDDDEPGDEAEDAADGGKDEAAEDMAADVAKLKAKGMSDAQATALAKQMAKRKKAQESQEDDMKITPEALTEALSSEDNRAALLEALQVPELIEEAVRETITAVWQRVPDLIEEAVATERDLIRATAHADANRRVQIERMRNEAHAMVEATTLPVAFKANVKSKFDLNEAGDPSPALDVVDDIDEDGEVAKKAEDKLKEAVDREIATARELAAAANPARVRQQGPSSADGEDEQKRKVAPRGSLTESLLMEAGFQDPEKVYDQATALRG